VQGQQRRQELSGVAFIVNDQNRQAGKRRAAFLNRVAAGSQRPSNGVDGKVDGECGTETFALAFDGDGATVRLRQVADDRQPQSKAAMFPGMGTVRLPESLECMREEFASHSHARVAHVDRDAGAFIDRTHLDLDAAARWSELHRVRQQVPENLPEPIGVAGDEYFFVGQDRPDTQILGVCGRTNRVDGGRNHAAEIDVLALQFESA
jgi:hypothetical protein